MSTTSRERLPIKSDFCQGTIQTVDNVAVAFHIVRIVHRSRSTLDLGLFGSPAGGSWLGHASRSASCQLQLPALWVHCPWYGLRMLLNLITACVQVGSHRFRSSDFVSSSRTGMTDLNEEAPAEVAFVPAKPPRMESVDSDMMNLCVLHICVRLSTE
jgi:hypothetical protein